MLAFSTCWNSARHTDGEAMLREIRDLGFDNVELGHGTRLSLVEGILKAVEKRLVRIVSVHNFCPLPPGVFGASPNLYLFSAQSELEWDNAVRHSRNTIDFARRIGAQCVVMHAGSVPSREWTHKLIALIKDGKRHAPKYDRMLNKALAQRARHHERPFARTVKTLQALVPYAAERNIQLGIETRYGLEEIPDEAEMAELLHLFPGQTIGYWHDCGHAQVRENLGAGKADQWLQVFSSRLVGFHVHDVAPLGDDHMALGDGNIDFSNLTRYWTDKLPCVLEFSPAVPPVRVVESHDFILQLTKAPTK